MLRFFAGVRPDFEQRAALATLIALHEVLPIPALGAIDYAWLPSIAPMKRAQALEFLIRSPKPLTCVALGISGTLAIGTWPLFRSAKGRLAFTQTGHATFLRTPQFRALARRKRRLWDNLVRSSSTS